MERQPWVAECDVQWTNIEVEAFPLIAERFPLLAQLRYAVLWLYLAINKKDSWLNTEIKAHNCYPKVPLIAHCMPKCPFKITNYKIYIFILHRLLMLCLPLKFKNKFLFLELWHIWYFYQISKLIWKWFFLLTPLLGSI